MLLDEAELGTDGAGAAAGAATELDTGVVEAPVAGSAVAAGAAAVLIGSGVSPVAVGAAVVASAPFLAAAALEPALERCG